VTFPSKIIDISHHGEIKGKIIPILYTMLPVEDLVVNKSEGARVNILEYISE
jgi:hypothetical protein